MLPEILFCNTWTDTWVHKCDQKQIHRVAFRTKLQFFYRCILQRYHQFWDTWDYIFCTIFIFILFIYFSYFFKAIFIIFWFVLMISFYSRSRWSRLWKWQTEKLLLSCCDRVTWTLPKRWFQASKSAKSVAKWQIICTHEKWCFSSSGTYQFQFKIKVCWCLYVRFNTQYGASGENQYYHSFVNFCGCDFFIENKNKKVQL